MASSLHVLNASKSIFDSVGLTTAHFVGKCSPLRIAFDEEMDDSSRDSPDERVDEDEETNMEVELERELESLSLILKLWLRTIYLSEPARRNELQDFEHEIYLTQEEVIKPYQALLKSRTSNDQEAYYDQQLEMACQKLLIEKDKVKFEMSGDDRRRLNMNSVFVCSLLGLKLDFLDSLEEMAPIHRNHRTLGNWIVRVLRNNTEFVAVADRASLTNDLLASIGFDPSSVNTAVDTILTRSSMGSMKHHIEACEWADIFIADEFKYNPLLSPSAVKFPFEANSSNTWFQLPNTAYAKTKDKITEDDLCHVVNVKNVVIKESLTSTITRSILSEKVLESEQTIVLYHGTDHHSAADILNRGIDLCCGRQKRDFSSGSGFYLTKSLDDALNWAKCMTSKPALLVFQISRSEFLNANKLNLENNLDKWRGIVSSFISGRRTARTRESLTAYDLIEGPMASVRRSQTSDELTVEPVPQSYQLCLNSEDFADEFQRTLHSILFFDVC